MTAGSTVTGREANRLCWRRRKAVEVLEMVTVVAGCWSSSVLDTAESVTHPVSAPESSVGLGIYH